VLCFLQDDFGIEVPGNLILVCLSRTWMEAFGTFFHFCILEPRGSEEQLSLDFNAGAPKERAETQEVNGDSSLRHPC
jgi:hypothetical protein